MTQEFQITHIAHISSDDHFHGKQILYFCFLTRLIAATTTVPMSAILPGKNIPRPANIPYFSGLSMASILFETSMHDRQLK
jgi:hypothetical protein